MFFQDYKSRDALSKKEEVLGNDDETILLKLYDILRRWKLDRISPLI